MFYDEKHHKNFVFHQIDIENSTISELVPEIRNQKGTSSLCFKDSSLYWTNIILNVSSKGSGETLLDGMHDNITFIKSLKGSDQIHIKDSSNGELVIDCSISFIKNNRLENTEIFYKDGRLGIGRIPTMNYKLDIQIPKDTLMTALHIGDENQKYGLSLGNGATSGFCAEVLGIGYDEYDCGLYLLGVAGNNLKSSIPLIIIDGRNVNNQALTNRPILGVTSNDYENYKVLIDQNGNINATDFIINGYGSLFNKIRDLENQIKELKALIETNI